MATKEGDMSATPQPDVLLVQARSDLGLALGRRAEECAGTVDARMGASRWVGKAPTSAYLDGRQQVSWFATVLVARWLVSSIRPDDAEMTWTSMRGRLAAEEGLSIINIARGYLAWRDTAVEILIEEAQRLHTPSTVLAEALGAARSSCDVGLMRMNAEFDRQLRIVSEERKRLEDQLRHQAFHDALSGLPNRALFMDRLTHAMERHARDEATVAVLVIDVDDFKAVNDSLGHLVGDQLIAEIGRRLQFTVRSADTVARFGGDEFAVLLENVASISTVIETTQRILAAFDTQFQLGERSMPVTASIGLAMATVDTDGPDGVVHNADIAMYVAKARGKARYVLFAPGMQLAIHDRIQQKTDLLVALNSGTEA
jgi:diguanylate cyclase (GGDEF)-like protein